MCAWHGSLASLSPSCSGAQISPAGMLAHLHGDVSPPGEHPCPKAQPRAASEARGGTGSEPSLSTALILQNTNVTSGSQIPPLAKSGLTSCLRVKHKGAWLGSARQLCSGKWGDELTGSSPVCVRDGEKIPRASRGLWVPRSPTCS